MRRSFTLLEVVVGLALLAALGVGLLQLQARAVRQYRLADRRSDVAEQTAAMLEQWSRQGEVVTLPATGRLGEHWAWSRQVEPVRVASGVLAMQVRLVIADADGQEVYRVAWLVPRAPPRGARP